MESSEADESLSYCISNRASAILNNKDREIGRVFAEYKDELVIIDGEYLIPKTKIDRYGDNDMFISTFRRVFERILRFSYSNNQLLSNC